MNQEEQKGVEVRLEAQVTDWIAVVVISLASLYVASRLSIYPVRYVDDLLRSVGGYELSFPSFWVCCALVGLSYHLVLEGSTGRTLGKMIVGIRVIKEDGALADSVPL